jgi:hypothetical protein
MLFEFYQTIEHATFVLQGGLRRESEEKLWGLEMTTLYSGVFDARWNKFYVADGSTVLVLNR